MSCWFHAWCVVRVVDLAAYEECGKCGKRRARAKTALEKTTHTQNHHNKLVGLDREWLFGASAARIQDGELSVVKEMGENG